MYGRRPLRLDELEEAIAVQDDSTSKSSTKKYSVALTESNVTTATGVILEIVDRKIHLVHQSAKDFLLKSGHLAEFEFCMNLHPSSYLSKVCMTYLCFTDLVESRFCRDDGLLTQEHIQHPFLQYAARNWYRHLEIRDDINKFARLIGQLTKPKSPTLLTWGEVSGIVNLEDARDTWEVAVKVNIPWLVELQMDCVVITKEIIEKAMANGMTEYDCLRRLVSKHDILFAERELCLVVEHLDHTLVQNILSKQTSTAISQNVFEATAANVKYGRLVVEAILEFELCFIITARFISLAQKNDISGQDIIRFIINNHNIEIPAEGVQQIVIGGDTELVKLLFRREQLNGLQLALESAVARVDYQMVMLLLDKGGNETVVTDKIMEHLVDSFDDDALRRLLQTHKGKARITENTVIKIAKNKEKRQHLLLLVLKELGEDFQITEEILRAILRTEDAENEVLKFLLTERNYEIHMTEECWKAAADNNYSYGETMGLLLSVRSHELHISEDILRRAAENSWCGHTIMRMFLETKGHDIQIAEAILKEMLRSGLEKEDILRVLKEAQGRGIQMNTAEMVKVAAGSRYGDHAMKALFELIKDEIQITEGVLKEVSRNTSLCAYQIMIFLLETKGNEIRITEDVLIEAARSHYDHDVLRAILDRISEEIMITDYVLKAAVGDESCYFYQLKQVASWKGGGWLHILGEELKKTMGKWFRHSMLIVIAGYKGKEIQISDEFKELMSEEQLDCWARSEYYLPKLLPLKINIEIIQRLSKSDKRTPFQNAGFIEAFGV